MLTVCDLNEEMQVGSQPRILSIHDHLLDVGPGLRDSGRYATKRPADVADGDSDAEVKKLPGIGLPIDMNPVVGLDAARFSHRSAGMGVNAQPLSFAQQADNRISRNRTATRRQLDCHAFGSADH